MVREQAEVSRSQAWLWSLLCVMFIPLFPQYITPFLSIAALLFACRDARRNHRRVRVGAAGKVVIAYLCFMTVHMLWATERMIGLAFLTIWITVFAAYLALTTILVTRRRLETALFSLSLIVGLIGLLAVVQYVLVGVCGITQMPLQVWDVVDEKVYGLTGLPINLHSLGVRPAATFPNPNMMAQFLLSAVPFVAAYGFAGQRSAAKILSRLALLFAVGGVFVSFSRGAYLALGAIAVVMCIANIRRLVPILMVGFSVLLLLPEAIYARLSTIGDAADLAINERFEVWGVTMQAVLERPLFGHGIGIGTIWPRLYECGFSAPHAHNLFLEFFVEGGFLGLILLLFLLWKLFRTGFELIIHAPKTRMYGAAVIAFVGGLCVCGMVDQPLFAPGVIAMFMTAIAFADALSFVEMNHTPLTVGHSLPFSDRIIPRLEAWVKRKTAPKGSEEAASDTADDN